MFYLGLHIKLLLLVLIVNGQSKQKGKKNSRHLNKMFHKQLTNYIWVQNLSLCTNTAVTNVSTTEYKATIGAIIQKQLTKMPLACNSDGSIYVTVTHAGYFHTTKTSSSEG